MLPRQPGLVRPVGFFYPAMTYTPKTEPFPHQKEVIERTRDEPGFALFHEVPNWITMLGAIALVRMRAKRRL